MGYIEKNLIPEERIVYCAHLHWVVFIGPIIWVILVIFCLMAGEAAAVVGVILIPIAIIHGIASLISYKSSEFGITNKRVLAKAGFIRRNSMEVLLAKVEGIQVNQGILGRILDYGTIIISGTGGSQNPFHKISSPLELRKKAQEQIIIAQKAK